MYELSGFRPLIRGFFFYGVKLEAIGQVELVFPSPHSGILFLSDFGYWRKALSRLCFRPLIRGFFFYLVTFIMHESYRQCFRPLIRGFFFYILSRGQEITIKIIIVSVPSFGDSFFIIRANSTKEAAEVEGFRPLIRGFFFYPVVMICRQV